jgi:siroheme synthase
MGMRHLPAIVARLLRDGVAADAAAACIANASLPGQRVVCARLAGLPAAVTAARITNPATVIVGAYCR